MTSLLFTHEKENGVRSTSRENLAFELWLKQRCSVTRQTFNISRLFQELLSKRPIKQLICWAQREALSSKHRAVHTTLPSHPRESDSLFIKGKSCSVTSPTSTALPESAVFFCWWFRLTWLFQCFSMCPKLCEIVRNMWGLTCNDAACADAHWPSYNTL